MVDSDLWIYYSCTVPLKGKLTVSTRFSKLDSRVAKVETFEFRDARIESRESRVEDRESRNEEFWNIHELEFVREFAIHLSKKDNNYVTQFSVGFSCCTCPLQVGSFRYTPLHYGVTVRKEYLTGIETSRVKTFKENKLEFRTFAETSSSELFLLVLQSTRKMIGFKQTSNNSRNMVDMIRTIMEILVRLNCFKVLVKFFFLIHIHTVHEMTPFTHQDAINKSSKIRKSKRTRKVTDRPARAFSRFGCVNTVTQLVYELYARKVWFIPLYDLLKHSWLSRKIIAEIFILSR